MVTLNARLENGRLSTQVESSSSKITLQLLRRSWKQDKMKGAQERWIQDELSEGR